MDGVLLDNDLYEDKNERYILENYSKLSGKPMSAVREKWNKYLAPLRHKKEWHDWRLACEHLGFEKLWIEAHLQNLKYLKLKPGAKKAVSALGKKYILVITSDAMKEVIDIKLGHFGMLSNFGHLFSQNSFKTIKNSKKYFAGVLRHLKLKKSEVVLVEDRKSRIKTAKEFGIKTIAIPYVYKIHGHMRRFQSLDPSCEAHYSIKRLSELPKLLEKLDKQDCKEA